MRNAVALAAMILLSACASITTGTQQSVFVDTPEVKGASCKLTDSKNGTWYLPSTPGSITVQKGNGPMNIVCEKDGYETAIVSVDETVVGATFGNIILGGGIGILIDATSGAAQEYPDKVTVAMKALPGGSPTASEAPKPAIRSRESTTERVQTTAAIDRKTIRPKGFHRLEDYEIRALFSDTNIDQYPDSWVIDFQGNGKWEGMWAGPRTVFGHGTWSARDGLHCLTILDHDGFSYESPDDGRCYEVWVDEDAGEIRFVDPNRPSDRTIVKEDAHGDIAKLNAVSR